MPNKSDYPQSANIQGYWKLDETSGNAVDYSGNSNTLTDTNSVGYNAEFFDGGNCRDFESGSSQYFRITDASQVGLDITGSLTICAWFKIESTGTSKYIISRGNSQSASAKGYWLYVSNTQNLEFYVSGNGTDTYGDSQGTVAVTEGWYHFGGRFNAVSDEIEAFCNGHGSGSPTTHTGSIYDNSGDIYVGQSGNNSYYFDGEFAELVVWNTALTDAEIKQAMEVWRP